VRIKHLFILSFFVLLTGLSAQNFQGGVSGGLNAARIDGDGHEFYGKLGLNAGVFVARAIVPEMLYWQMELKYTSRGKYHIYRDQMGGIVDLSLIDLRYAELPLSIHYFLNEKVQLELGFSPDLLLREHYEDGDGILPVEDANDLRRFGITAFAGANYFVLEPLAVGIRFNYSVLPFYKFRAYAVRYRDSGWFHDVISINARYYFTR
jgi:opacity protein-like surface antigen